jgi:hypothetical protein
MTLSYNSISNPVNNSLIIIFSKILSLIGAQNRKNTPLCNALATISSLFFIHQLIFYCDTSDKKIPNLHPRVSEDEDFKKK